MKIKILVIVICMLCAWPAMAQRTTRGKLKAITAAKPVAEQCDTIWGDSCRVSFSGFEKTLRSRRESVFATNEGNVAVTGICLEINYEDMDGNQLHKRRVNAKCDIPAGETRLLTFPSWDAQQVWYYHLSDKPRTRQQATPFRITATPLYLLTPMYD